jgi:hypothetical protein
VVVTKLEVDIDALAVLSVEWPVVAAVEDAEVELADGLVADVSREHFVAGPEVAIEVAVVGASAEKSVEEFVAG